MRLALPVLALAGLALAACASTESGAGPGQNRLQQLAEECRARGGVLTPTGANTGRVEVDNACTIRGGSTRR